jgi:hypothetical protein
MKQGNKMPSRIHQNFFNAYLQMVSETEPSADYHLWVAVQLIASCLGRKCEVRFGPQKYFPNFYIILVGPPGARKGTAISYGASLVKNVKNLTFAPDTVTRPQFFQELENANTLVTLGDTVLSHCSLLVVADELATFLGDNDPQRIADLCRIYDGVELHEYKTKHSGSYYISNPAVWLLGATTPNWIETCMPQLAVGGGITSRIVFVYSPKKDKHIPLTQMKEFDPKLVAELIHDMRLINEMQGSFFVDKSGDEVFTKWYLDIYPKNQPEDSRLVYFMDRLPAHVAKLSIVTSAARRDTMTITGPDVAMAIKMFDAIIPHMTHALGGMGLNILSRQTEMVRLLLKERGPLPKSVIMKNLRMHINEYDYVRVKIALVSEKFLTAHYNQELKEEILTPIEGAT